MDMMHNKDKCQFCANKMSFKMPNEIIASVHDIVLFVGAGVSTESRSIFPDTFYDIICDELKISRTKGIPFSKVMTLYCRKTNGKHQLMNKIKERLDYFKMWPELYKRATEFHREVALLPCIKTIITTNWDDFFETEAHAIPFVYPQDFTFWDQPFKKVLKIHGSINNLGSIIATEEDYKRCYRNLHRGLIGSQMKLFLAKNIIIYIGYSFQDEDFQGMYKFVEKEMKNYKKQSYVVTLDKSADEKWKKLNLIPIYTDGTYFIQKIRHELERKGCISSLENLSNIFILRDIINKKHGNMRKYDVKKFPEIVYCMSYHDGLLHSFDYMIGKLDYGYTLCKRNIYSSIKEYVNILKRYEKHKGCYDYSYVRGFLNGLCVLIAHMENEPMKELVPYYYNEVYREEYFDEYEFKKSLKRTKDSNKIRRLVREIVTKKNIGKDIALHHIPRLS